MSDLQHRYTESDLARNISNPENKKDGWFYIEPLANEYITDENGTYLNTQAYIERALQIEPKLGSLLQKNDPINEPTYWDITKENLEQIPSQFAEGWATELDVRTNVLMGVNENPKLDYISQEEYQKRKAAGEKPEDIWPHLTDSSNRTWTDWWNHTWEWNFGNETESAKEVRTRRFQERMAQGEQFDLTNPFNVKAEHRLNKRIEFYEKGGEVNEKGLWQNADGTKSGLNTTWTPVEWNTREQYEKRKESDTNWSDGVLRKVKQDFLYEWLDKKSDVILAIAKEKRHRDLNDPAFQELQAWAQANPYTDASNLLYQKKLFNTFMHASSSFVGGTMPAIGAELLTMLIPGGKGKTAQKISRISTKALRTTGRFGSIASMGAMDASGMYNETVDYALQQGYSEREAHEMAETYYNAYFLASMSLERIPINKLFRRNVALPKRKAMIRSVHEGKFKKFILNAKEHIINVGPIAKNKLVAMAAQGWSEGITELAQYTTETALKADYRTKDNGLNYLTNFASVGDVNEALESLIGGFLMGGAIGGFGGRSTADTDSMPAEELGVKYTAGKALEGLQTFAGKLTGQGVPTKTTKTPVITGTTTGTETGTSPSVTTDATKVPENLSEYAEMIVTQQIDGDQTLNPNLVDLIRNQNKPKSPLTSLIFKHQVRDFEGYPDKKLADIVEQEGNYDFIDGMNLDESKKAEIKERIAAELVRQKKSPLTKKREESLTDAEKKKLNVLEDVNLDDIVDSLQKGENIDELLGEEIEASLQIDSDQSLEEDLEEEIQEEEAEALKKAGIEEATPEMLAQAEDEASIQIGDGGKKAAPLTSAKQKSVTKGTQYTKESPAEKLTRQISEQQSLLKTYENQLKKAPDNKKAAIQKDIDKVKNRIETLNKKIDNEGLRQQEIAAESKDEGPVDTKKKDTKKKTKVSDNPEDSNYYIQSEKSIVSKLSNAKLEKLIKEKEDSKQSIDKTDLKALNAEKARREAVKTKKSIPTKIKKQIDNQRKPVDLGVNLDSELDAAMNDAGIMSYEEVLQKAESGEITLEEDASIKQELEDNKQELKDKNCL